MMTTLSASWCWRILSATSSGSPPMAACSSALSSNLGREQGAAGAHTYDPSHRGHEGKPYDRRHIGPVGLLLLMRCGAVGCDGRRGAPAPAGESEAAGAPRSQSRGGEPYEIDSERRRSPGSAGTCHGRAAGIDARCRLTGAAPREGGGRGGGARGLGHRSRAHQRARRAAADHPPRSRQGRRSPGSARGGSADLRRRRVHVLDLRRPGARQVHPRAPGRHRRVPPAEPPGQQDAAQHRPARRDGARRRRHQQLHGARTTSRSSPSRRSTRACTSTTARRRRSACTSPTACTG